MKVQRMRWPSESSLQRNIWKVGEVEWLLQGHPLSRTRTQKLSCFDRLFHEGECATFRVSTDGANREVHKRFPTSEVWVLKDVMYAGFRRILRRNTVGRRGRMKKRWAGSRSKGLAVFSHRL